jgi:diguanylate cyclase (GGDEF)-like protein/PAS domain S-box-containing protein
MADDRDAQLLTILDRLPVAVMLRAADGRLLHLNPGAERFIARLGVGVDAIAPSPSSLMDHVEVVDEHGQPQAEDDLPVVVAAREARDQDATLGYGLPGGGYAWYSTRAAPVTLCDGTTGTVVTVDDVTERHEDRRRTLLAERSLRRTFDAAPIGVAVFGPDGRLHRVNAALCELLGHPEEVLLARGLRVAAHPDDREIDRVQLEDWAAGADARFLVDRRFRHASGRELATQLSVAVVPDEDGVPVHLIVQIVDLTARRRLEDELRAAAVQDPLTGVANRRALVDRLQEAQLRQDREGGRIGLIYLDLDRFKEVNDTHGHDIGDQVLRATADRLVGATRELDTVCRLGGDEFVILSAPLGGEVDLDELVGRLRAMPPVAVDAAGTAVQVRCSIGAVIVAAAEDLDDALRRADSEMYRAKREVDGRAGTPRG